MDDRQKSLPLLFADTGNSFSIEVDGDKKKTNNSNSVFGEFEIYGWASAAIV